MEAHLKSLFLKTKISLLPFFRLLISTFRRVDVAFCVLTLAVLVYQFGFGIPEHQIGYASLIYKLNFLIYVVSLTVWQSRQFSSIMSSRRFYGGFFYYLLVLITFLAGWVLPKHLLVENPLLNFFDQVWIVYIFVAIHVVFSLSQSFTRSLNQHLNPNWLFVGSFLFLIFAGTGLLMLPKATYLPISFLEALFTSVSAVCVTGLVVVDTASAFTPIGKTIIILLIQAGGIGIMTFTSFLGLFSNTRQSLQNQFIIKNVINNDESISNLFSGLRNIIIVTFFVEFFGALFLYYSAGGDSWTDVFVSVFHSISAFCNAGFSIVPDGLYNSTFSNNYSYLTAVSFLIIIGGLGFPIIFNLFTLLKYMLVNQIRFLFGEQKHYKHIPRILNSNTVIVMYTTIFLLVSGTVLFYFTEFDNVLAPHKGIGKIASAFFLSVTPRTAGFNSFDMTQLYPMTVMWMIFYMWIGASPMSTGGGIKTTTFGIAILNIWNTLRGRDHIEIRYRQIAASTVNRAFVVIFISIVILSMSTMLISWLDPQVPLRSVLFECVSAISTVGLSINVTPTLSHQSQIVLIVLMFVGRIGFLSILSCFIKPRQNLNYQFPHENISIN